MRKLTVGAKRGIEVLVGEQPGLDNACFIYKIGRAKPINKPHDFMEFGFIKFQDGPIRENGVNGCQNEDLIAIVINRLKLLQKGKFPCKENRIAIASLQDTLYWLDERTKDRIKRGVEGTNQA